MGCLGLIIIIAIIFIVISALNSNSRNKELQKALEAYQKSLAELKQNPTNPNIRQKTLSLGRVYSNLTRNNKGVTIYDEMALMNDINAACAAATAVNTQLTRNIQNQKSTIESRLAKLDELRSKNLISQNEYDEKRKAILDEI